MLEDCLKDFQVRCELAFLTSLQKQVNSKLVKVEAPPRDLSPTSAVTGLLAILRDMLSTANMSEGRETDMGKVKFMSLDSNFILTIFWPGKLQFFVHLIKYCA